MPSKAWLFLSCRKIFVAFKEVDFYIFLSLWLGRPKRDLRSGAIEEPCISQLTWRLVQFRPLCGPGVSAMLRHMLRVKLKCDFDQYVTVVVGAQIKSWPGCRPNIRDLKRGNKTNKELLWGTKFLPISTQRLLLQFPKHTVHLEQLRRRLKNSGGG